MSKRLTAAAARTTLTDRSMSLTIGRAPAPSDGRSASRDHAEGTAMEPSSIPRSGSRCGTDRVEGSPGPRGHSRRRELRRRRDSTRRSGPGGSSAGRRAAPHSCRNTRAVRAVPEHRVGRVDHAIDRGADESPGEEEAHRAQGRRSGSRRRIQRSPRQPASRRARPWSAHEVVADRLPAAGRSPRPRSTATEQAAPTDLGRRAGT